MYSAALSTSILHSIAAIATSSVTSQLAYTTTNYKFSISDTILSVLTFSRTSIYMQNKTQALTVVMAIIAHTIKNLSALLPLSADANGLTYLKSLFTIAIDIDPHSLMINRDIEYFLFIDLHSKYKWHLFDITSSKYIVCMELFNAKLKKKYYVQNKLFIIKNLYVFINKFSEIEPFILMCILNKNYKCKFLEGLLQTQNWSFLSADIKLEIFLKKALLCHTAW